jgi:hypothetical protein
MNFEHRACRRTGCGAGRRPTSSLVHIWISIAIPLFPLIPSLVGLEDFRVSLVDSSDVIETDVIETER